MNVNPYQTSGILDDEPVQGPLPKPRYSGPITRRAGTASQEAVEQFTSVPPSKELTENAKRGGGMIWVFFAIGGLTTLLFLNRSRSESITDSLDLPAVAPAALARAAWWVSMEVVMLTLPVVVLVGLVFAVWFFRRDPWRADPPVWGTKSVTLHPTFWEAEMTHLDGQSFVARFAWSATAVSQNEDSWLLLGGFANPAMIAKGAAGSSERSLIESFFQQLVDYQHQEQIQTKLMTLDYCDELPPPHFESRAFRFSVDQSQHRSLRLRIARHFKKRHPDWKIDLRSRTVSIALRCIGWSLITAGVAVAAGLAFVAGSIGIALSIVVLNAIFAGPALVYLGRAMEPKQIITGWISPDHLFIVNGPTQSRVALKDYPKAILAEFPNSPRLNIKNGSSVMTRVLAIVSASGGQYLFLPESDLAVPQEFDDLSTMVLEATGAST